MQKFYDILKKLDEKKGCNIDLHYNIKNLKDGYMVSIAKYEKILDEKNYINEKKFGIDLINALREKRRQVKELKTLNPKSAFYIGLWVNDNKLYIDISIKIKDFKTAFNRGIKENQYYIYDLENQKEVAIVKDVFIVYQYNKIKNDFIYYYECMTRHELYNSLGISERRARDVIVNSIDNFDLSKLYLNKYCIVKDSAFYRDLDIQ